MPFGAGSSRLCGGLCSCASLLYPLSAISVRAPCTTLNSVHVLALVTVRASTIGYNGEEPYAKECCAVIESGIINIVALVGKTMLVAVLYPVGGLNLWRWLYSKA